MEKEDGPEKITIVAIVIILILIIGSVIFIGLGIKSSKDSGNNFSFFCTERWECSEWGPCSDSIQSRTCEEVRCGTEKNKPLEQRSCDSEIAPESQEISPAKDSISFGPF